MKQSNNIIAAALYIVLFALHLPLYRYSMDPDGISYLNMANRYANNGFVDSVNGYWSPLGSWLLVPFIKAGLEPVITLKIINGILGLLSLFSCISLQNKFNIHPVLKKIMPYAFVALLLSFCFHELFADLLLVFLLSLYLNLVFGNNFISSRKNLLLAGLLGALCYFAKAYCFPFFLLYTTIVLFMLCKKKFGRHFIKPFIKKVILVYAVFFVITSPYLYALYKKYDAVLISTAGKLNNTWFLAPGFNSDNTMVIAPPYKEAISYWDEPAYKKEKTLSPFNSAALFFKQIKLIGSNTISFSQILFSVSVFSFFILAGFIFYLFKRKKETTSGEWILLLTIILLPAGYLLIIIEWRYVWILSMLLLIAGCILLTKFLSNKMLPLAGIILAASFTIKPIIELQELKQNNYKDVVEMAAIFKQKNVQGNFFVSNQSQPEVGKVLALCYLTKSKLLGVYKSSYSLNELKKSVEDYNVNYYIALYQTEAEKNTLLQSTIAKTAKNIYTDLYPGLLLFQLK